MDGYSNNFYICVLSVAWNFLLARKVFIFIYCLFLSLIFIYVESGVV